MANLEEEDVAERESLMSQKRITRDDLESQFRQLQNSVQRSVDEKKNSVFAAAAIGGVALLVIFFLLGHRRGKKKTTLVEISRL